MRTFRINVAEIIVALAKILMPKDYLLEGERAAGMEALEGIYTQFEIAGLGDYKVTLMDIFEAYKTMHPTPPPMSERFIGELTD